MYTRSWLIDCSITRQHRKVNMCQPVMLTRTQEARPRPRPRKTNLKSQDQDQGLSLTRTRPQKIEYNQETSATMAQYLNKQAQIKTFKSKLMPILPARHETATWLSAWCTISRTNWQGQPKANDLITKSRPRPRIWNINWSTIVGLKSGV